MDTQSGWLSGGDYLRNPLGVSYKIRGESPEILKHTMDRVTEMKLVVTVAPMDQHFLDDAEQYATPLVMA
jgi:hypothetical protein